MAVKYIFLTLCALFCIHSYQVYTTGTMKDNGAHWLTEEAKAGKLVFQKYNCISCHQLYGLGGYMGPDLTNIMQDTLRKPYVKAILKTGTARMPDFKLSDQEVEAITAFMDYAAHTGAYPLKKYRITPFANVEIHE